MKYKVSYELQINIIFKCFDQVNAVANINCLKCYFKRLDVLHLLLYGTRKTMFKCLLCLQK